MFYTVFIAQTANAYVQNKAQVDSHHVIFDNLGKLSTGITYINVAIPLNISVMSQQINIFDQFLDNILNTYPDTNSTNSTYLKHETINQQNMQNLVKSITSYSRQRLMSLINQLETVSNLLPKDTNFDRNNERHKRFIFMIPMILCEVNKKTTNDENTKLNRELESINGELDQYKKEYARLYDATMPEVVPEYLDENFDMADDSTLWHNAKVLERQTRDVKFLLNIIKREKRGAPISYPRQVQEHPDFQRQFGSDSQPNFLKRLESSTTSPFRDFETIFGKQNATKRRGSNSFWMTPDPKFTTTPTPFSSNKTKALSTHREKRFVLAAALASGILGTFFGLYNTIEIGKIQEDLRDLGNNQRLLIEFTKTMEFQIMTTQQSLNHLESIFGLYIKNNPALLYAKFNDQLLTLQDRIYNLKDTVQMLQLQKLSTSLLTSTQLFSLYDEIEEMATTNKLSLLTTKPQDLFQIDASYIRVKDEILILLHVPCANPSNLLTIYKYVPFPIPVFPAHNHTTNTDNTIQNLFEANQNSPLRATEGITFQPEADLIAIGKNSYNKNRFILLSSAELQACTKRSTAFICERHQVTRSDLLSSCLGSLFLQSSTGVLDNCKINRVNLREKVYQISNTQHIVYTPSPLNTQIICNNGSYYPLKIKNTKFVTIPEGCSTELYNHSITSDFTIRTTSQSIYFEWDFDPTTLPNSAEMLTDSKTIDIKLAKLNKLIERISKDEIDPHEFDALMRQHYASGSWFSSVILALLIFSGLIGVVSISICARNYLARGRTAAVDDHVVYQRTNHPESDDDDDEIARIVRRGTHRDSAPAHHT